MKRRGSPTVMVTAYDVEGGRLADDAGATSSSSAIRLPRWCSDTARRFPRPSTIR
jgi:hypothetical protein